MRSIGCMLNHSSDGLVARRFLTSVSMAKIEERSTGFLGLTRAKYCGLAWCLGDYAHHSKLSIGPSESDEFSEGERSCPGANGKDLRLEYSILPLRSGIGLRRRSSASKFHCERQDRLHPTSVEAHERQYKGRLGEPKNPEELDSDHS